MSLLSLEFFAVSVLAILILRGSQGPIRVFGFTAVCSRRWRRQLGIRMC
jgi:hypothetical protein